MPQVSGAQEIGPRLSSLTKLGGVLIIDLHFKSTISKPRSRDLINQKKVAPVVVKSLASSEMSESQRCLEVTHALSRVSK